MNSQIGYAPGYSKDRKDTVPSGVPSLNKLGGPAAITRLVVPIVVDPVKAQSSGAFPHVLKECHKRQRPTLAYGYSPVVVIWGTVKRWLASLPHVVPRLIGATRSVITVAMRGPSLQRQAPARACVSTQNVSPLRYCLFSAFAKTPYPCSRAAFAMGRRLVTDYFKPSKRLSYEGLSVSHRSAVVLLICDTLRDLQVAGAFSL